MVCKKGFQIQKKSSFTTKRPTKGEPSGCFSKRLLPLDYASALVLIVQYAGRVVNRIGWLPRKSGLNPTGSSRFLYVLFQALPGAVKVLAAEPTRMGKIRPEPVSAIGGVHAAEAVLIAADAHFPGVVAGVFLDRVPLAVLPGAAADRLDFAVIFDDRPLFFTAATAAITAVAATTAITAASVIVAESHS